MYEKLLSAIKTEKDLAERNLAEFQTSMTAPKQGPLHAFTWYGEQALTAVARIAAWEEVLAYFQNHGYPGVPANSFKNEVQYYLMGARTRMCTPPVRSTSPVSVILGDETRMAWVQVVKLLGRYA